MYALRRILFLFLITSTCAHFSAQKKMKDYSRIMRSTSIYEIDAFLKTAHPDDPKRLILKPRLVKLLKDYIQNAHPADQRVAKFQEMIALLQRGPSTKIGFEEMNEQIRQKQIAKLKQELEGKSGSVSVASSAGGAADTAPMTAVVRASSSALDADEQEEFLMLMAVSPTEHKNKTVKILNSLFDNDPTSTESIVMIENKSACNMIMRLEGVGNTKYRLAVPTGAENSIVVQKGNYLFTSKVCGAEYASQKAIQKAVIVSLNNPGK